MQPLLTQKIKATPTTLFFAWLQRGLSYLPGLTVSVAVAGLAILLGRMPWLQSHGLGALTLAIVLGMLLGNTLYPRIAAHCGDGIGLAKQRLLRIGIVLYGFRLTFHDIGQVGWAGVAIDALVLSSTFLLALLIGIRVLKMDRDTVILIGAGNSICGAAAVLATEPVLDAKPEQVAVAISTVVVFGTLAVFMYPVLYQWCQGWQAMPVSATRFGIYAGSTIHEVAQVVAAARMISEDAANTAIIAKMVRVMMLAPFLLLLSALVSRHRNQTLSGGQAGGRNAVGQVVIPWFALVFVLAVCCNSLITLPDFVLNGLIDLDTLLLAIAMAALGLTTHVSAVRRAGAKPMLLAAVLFGWLTMGGAAMNLLLSA